MFSIATVNVNGIRAAFRRGMGAWIDQHAPDVILMQEVRATDEILAGYFGDDWHLVHEAGAVKGHAGVAIASRHALQRVRVGLSPQQRPDDQIGRWVEADLEIGGTALTVVSTYIHSGTVGTPSMPQKYAFLEEVTTRLGQLRDQGGCVVVAGDVNIGHTELDIKNWKGNRKNSGFLPEERAYLDRWTGELGWTDLGRYFAGQVEGPYTWWSYRGKAFDNDAGWRIDYQFVTEEMAARAKDAVVDRAPAYDQRFSDHAPLRVTYDL